jgi:serine/threonine protein kinase
MIGSGYTSKVYKGTRLGHPGESFAIKVIRLRGMGMANTYLLSSEVDIMQGLEHPHIVKLIEVLYTNNHCYLVTEYCEGGTLERYVQGKESVEWGSIVHQISQGCQYLAGLNIVHRDLKPANIFQKDGRWKIGDFGFAKRLPSAEALIVEGFRVGSPLFMPLETL